MEAFLTLIVLVLIMLISPFLYLYVFSPSQKKSTNKRIKIHHMVGILREFIKNPTPFLDWTTETLRHFPNNTAVIGLGQRHEIFTASPLNLEHILKTNFDNYPKGDRFTTVLEDLFGRTMFTVDGELWKVQRRSLSYEFNTKSLRNYAMDHVRFEVLTRLFPILAEASVTKQVLDLQNIFERFAFDNICRLAFNVDLACLGEDGIDGGEFMHAFDEATTVIAGRFLHIVPQIWKFKRFFNIGSERKLRKSIIIVHEFADKIIQSRLEQKNEEKDEDILSRCIRNGENTPKSLRDIVIGLILGGRDNTSSALSWFFWLLSRNPNVERNIKKELRTIRERNGGKIGDTFAFEQLNDMHYLNAAISETLRLYPPSPLNMRTCRRDDVLPDGTFVGRNWSVTFHAYAMGRAESIWGKNCGEFVPERWLDEDGKFKQESPYKFPVFLAGPRMCPGKDMAYIQIKSIAASIIERFEIDVQNKEKCPEHLFGLTLRMKDGLGVTVKERCVEKCT